MADPCMLLAQAAEPSPYGALLLPLMMFTIFYFIWYQPMQRNRKKLEELQKALKAGDKVIITPGFFATVVAAEEDALTVRLDEKTKVKVLRSAVAGLQGEPLPTENK
jgi:preprotein translocase subunit YajC